MLILVTPLPPTINVPTVDCVLDNTKPASEINGQVPKLADAPEVLMLPFSVAVAFTTFVGAEDATVGVAVPKPVPVRLLVAVLLLVVVLVTVIVAVCAPVAVGVKLTVYVLVPPFAVIVPKLVVLNAKTPLLVATVTLAASTVPEFVTVNVRLLVAF